MNISKNSIFRCKVHSAKLLTKYEKNLYLKFFSFIADVVDTADKHSFAIISVNKKKNENDPNWIPRDMR